MSVFTLRDLGAGYHRKPVLFNISISFGEGDFIALIGPNGSGKSTLLKTLTGIIRPSGGSVSFRGMDMADIDPRRFATEVSVVSQFIENILPFTVRQFVELGRFPHQRIMAPLGRADIERIAAALSLTGIDHLADKLLTELSGGERQLASIARAIAQSDRVIVLDEPISHLDIRHSIQIMDLLYDLNQKGTTIITVLHDINIAANYCGRIVGLKEGRVFMDGAPEAVITYAGIEALFDTRCLVYENPTTKRPSTFMIPGHIVRSGND